ncbi:MAG: hypothetical protein R2844_07915 [Caldilineales bacterium]
MVRNYRKMFSGAMVVGVILFVAPVAVSAVRQVDAQAAQGQLLHEPTFAQEISPVSTPAYRPGLTTRGYLPRIVSSATATPIAVMHVVDVNPAIAVPGDDIWVTTGNWTPGISVSVSLVEAGLPFSQSVAVPGTTVTTPANPAIGFTIGFVFPEDPRWTLGSDVWVIVHNADWTELGRGVLELREP